MSNENKKPTAFAHFIAGGIGGTVGATITCPLEVIKTRLQTSLYRDDSHLGIFRMARKIYAEEGIRGLWRGIGPNIVGVFPSRAIYFSSYASTKQYLTDFNNGKESSTIHLLSAATAGVCVSTVTNPIWLVKTRMQMQSKKSSTPSIQETIVKQVDKSTITKASISKFSTNAMSSVTPQYKNSFDCLMQIIKHEGALGLFRGLGASYLGILEGTIQWVTYEHLKTKVREYRPSNTRNDKINSYEYFLVAAASKFFAAVIAYPHEVLRTRVRQVHKIQRDGKTVTVPLYNGFKDVITRVIREEGLLAFYGGITAHLMRTVPNAAIMFLCYETIISLF